MLAKRIVVLQALEEFTSARILSTLNYIRARERGRCAFRCLLCCSQIAVIDDCSALVEFVGKFHRRDMCAFELKFIIIINADVCLFFFAFHVAT